MTTGELVVAGLGILAGIGGIVEVFFSKPGTNVEDEYREDGFNSAFASNRGRIAGWVMLAIGAISVLRVVKG